MKVVVVGGGWAGCGAAYCAEKNGAEVVLLERTDSLLGTGLVGGIMRNNGRFTATEEMIAMGGGDLFEIIDSCCNHVNIEFPGHKHASLYDIAKTPVAITDYLLKQGVEIHLKERVIKVQKDGDRLLAVETACGNVYEGDVFIDATGTAGPMNNCVRYGNGCCMCVVRCPAFGGRISLAGLCGVKEITGQKADGSIGAMSGSCKLFKESLAPEILKELNEKGVVVVPLPKELIEDHLSMKACQQYALKEFAENIVLLDTGHAKMMTPFYPLEKLHKVPGFENARYEDPYAGSQGNSMRFFDMSPREDDLKVIGMDNLFCGGEKAGLLVGHTEALVTGILAGYNSVRYASGQETLTLPRETAIGEAISYVNEMMKTQEGIGRKYTFSGSVFFERMKELNLYTTDISAIRKRIGYLGLTNIFGT